MGNRMNYEKLTKSELINLLRSLEFKINVLDLMLSDMSGVDVSDIQKWLNMVQSKFNEINKENNIVEDIKNEN